MKWLHFDSTGGASGDMLLGALVDVGAPLDALNRLVDSFRLGPVIIQAAAALRRGVSGTCVTVNAPPEHTHHEHAVPAGAAHGHAHAPHRGLADIEHILEHSALPPGARERAARVFRRLAAAEAKIHACDIQKIHFHEVGAVDSIVDIAGACWALDWLNVDGVSVGVLPLGQGTVRCAHGTYPAPAPATLELLQGMAVEYIDEPFETVTPTGAALLAEWKTAATPPAGCVLKTGYGLGHADLRGRPNVLRATLLEVAAPTPETELCLVLETNVDDTTPECVGALCGRLMEAGALDAFIAPIHMKKWRAGMLLTVLCAPAQREAMLDLIFRESTTLGVREHITRRTMLARRVESVKTPYGAVRIKTGLWKDVVVVRAPEMEDCIALARSAGAPVRAVYEAARKAAD